MTACVWGGGGRSLENPCAGGVPFGLQAEDGTLYALHPVRFRHAMEDACHVATYHIVLRAVYSLRYFRMPALLKSGVSVYAPLAGIGSGLTATAFAFCGYLRLCIRYLPFRFCKGSLEFFKKSGNQLVLRLGGVSRLCPSVAGGTEKHTLKVGYAFAQPAVFVLEFYVCGFLFHDAKLRIFIGKSKIFLGFYHCRPSLFLESGTASGAWFSGISPRHTEQVHPSGCSGRRSRFQRETAWERTFRFRGACSITRNRRAPNGAVS